MTIVRINLSATSIYIELKDGNLTFEVTTFEGLNSLSDEEAREVYDILHKRFAE